ENARRVRMRRVLHHGHDERRGRDALPHVTELEHLADLESLLLQLARMLDLASQADRIGAARQQIHQLPPVLLLQWLLVDKKLADEFRALLRIEIGRKVAGGTAAQRILSFDFALPFRVEQVVGRFQVSRLHIVFIDEHEALDVAEKHQHVLPSSSMKCGSPSFHLELAVTSGSSSNGLTGSSILSGTSTYMAVLGPGMETST